MFPRESSLKHAFLFVALCLATTLLFAADNPWKSKPYQTWSAQDVQRIMTDSPWVQVTTVRRSWIPVAEKDVPPSQEIAGGIRSMPGASGAVQTNAEASDRGSEASTNLLHVYIYWYSSRAIRAASARQAVLHGAMNPSGVEQFTNAPQAEYEIALRMDDMTPFMQKDEKFYQGNAFLEIRRSKLKLPPSKVLYEPAGTRSVKNVVFFFPKKTSEGLPTIAGDESDVEFDCQVGDSTLRVDFKPKKMVDQFGADL